MKTSVESLSPQTQEAPKQPSRLRKVGLAVAGAALVGTGMLAVAHNDAAPKETHSATPNKDQGKDQAEVQTIDPANFVEFSPMSDSPSSIEIAASDGVAVAKAHISAKAVNQAFPDLPGLGLVTYKDTDGTTVYGQACVQIDLVAVNGSLDSTNFAINNHEYQIPGDGVIDAADGVILIDRTDSAAQKLEGAENAHSISLLVTVPGEMHQDIDITLEGMSDANPQDIHGSVAATFRPATDFHFE